MFNQLYIDLMKKLLLDLHRIERDEYKPLYHNMPDWKQKIVIFLDKILRNTGNKRHAICQRIRYNYENRLEGKDWPSYADSMIGLKRMENIEYCFKEVIKNNVEGDFIETGVWRGGATIFMNALLKAANISDRKVWVADSFEGLPAPDAEKYPADKGDVHYLVQELAISMETVKQNFKKYDLLDDNVRMLKGWFKDTLPNAPIDKLAIARLDGDMYESTMDGLVNLYPKLSQGGFCIIDDWGAVPACKQAVLDYRQKHGITADIIPVDWTCVFWKK